jgi:hypothetical protein
MQQIEDIFEAQNVHEAILYIPARNDFTASRPQFFCGSTEGEVGGGVSSVEDLKRRSVEIEGSGQSFMNAGSWQPGSASSSRSDALGESNYRKGCVCERGGIPFDTPASGTCVDGS